MPAGGFDQAVAAIDGGADALYLGFSDFSARRQARNFGRDEYRRLRLLSERRGIKLYVALNTVLLEEEIGDIARLLAFLGRFPPDAILVQDWGLAALIRERHPGIPIHASTQAAVQGGAAVRIARELGATRIVLPRETSLAEMRRLRAEAPELEYEAFIHGALCYSFSGLCLASGLVLGRSGNRGECAQLCRSYYDAEGRGDSGREERGYWFSCRDLELGDRIADLAAAGIASLKVEGRMKGPEYCHAVARYYRGILDRLGGSDPGDEELARRRDAARTAFSRSPTTGWLYERGGDTLVDSEYPGHRGVMAGTVRSSSARRLRVDLGSELGLRDGLLAFEDGDPFKPVRFPVLGLRDIGSGREVFKASAGGQAEIDAPLDEGRPVRLAPGAPLYRISARDMDRRAVALEEYEGARQSLELKLRFCGRRLGAELELPGFQGPGASPVPGAADGLSESPAISQDRRAVPIEAGEELVLDRARSPGGFAKALGVFSESGDADFRLVPRFDPDEEVALPPGPSGEARSCPAAELFVPPSILKREKNRIYALAAAAAEAVETSYAREGAGWSGPGALGLGAPSAQAASGAPPRAALVFPRPELPRGMPFAMKRDLADDQALPEWGGRRWLPLAPLVLDREEYGDLAVQRIGRELASGASISVGLGALHHFAWAREALRSQDDRETLGRLGFFLDFNLYVANRLAYRALASLIGGVDFAYGYLEEPRDPQIPDAAIPLAAVGPDFEPPLFQSLGCALKHHLSGGSCRKDCPKLWSTRLKDRDRRYRLLVEDCVTMLFRDRENASI